MSTPNIDALESVIGDSRRDLPQGVFLFVSRLTPLVNVNLLIQDQDLFVMETIGVQEIRGHAISLLFRRKLVGPQDDARRASFDLPTAGKRRGHESAQPDLLEAQRAYAQFL